jgi:predicted amidohydrolase YtcJ
MSISYRPPQQRLLYNANIYTLNPALPRASQMLIRDGVIEAVGGSDANFAGLIMRDALRQDMGGAMIIPGLVDSHIHWSWVAQKLRQIDLSNVPSLADAVAQVDKQAAQTAAGSWITGVGWGQGQWAETNFAFPTASDLDAVTANKPTCLKARSGHASWVNSLALQLAEITDSTPDPAGGKIVRDAAGKATGILLETAMNLVDKHVPPIVGNELAALMEESQKLLWAVGLTGLHDYDGPAAMEAIQRLHRRGALGLRVVKNINDPFIDHAIALGLHWGFGDDWLRLGGLKIFADGALGSLTAAMLAPYEGHPNNHGIFITHDQPIDQMVWRASQAGFPSTIHAIGDAAVRQVLDAYAFVRQKEAENGIARTARRHRIEHVQHIGLADENRLASLDLIASMQPIHATADYQMADRYLGPVRARRSYNARAQIDHGARVAFGSDAPIEPYDPLRGIFAAITRRREDGSPNEEGWYPENRITLTEALLGYTQGAAYAAGMEGKLGQLTAGYLADLVVLDHNLYSLAAQDLLRAKVVATMTGGIWRYGP